jgi:ClpP class serine protease
MSIAKVREVADGRVVLAAKARELGLIDAVSTIDEATKFIHKDLRATERQQAATQRARSESVRRQQAIELAKINT